MSSIFAYLTFNGNCREAMQFYKDCFGGDLQLITVGEAPWRKKMPAKIKSCILHSVLTNNNLVLMGTDMVGDNGLLKGNAVSLLINCSSEKDVRLLYKKLSVGAEQINVLEITHWGSLFGTIMDKYGNNWLLQFCGRIKQPQKKSSSHTVL